MPIIAVNSVQESNVINIPNNFISLTALGGDVYDLNINFYFDLSVAKFSKAFKVRLDALDSSRNTIDSNTNSLLRNSSILDTQIAMSRVLNGTIKNTFKTKFSTSIDLTTSIDNSFSSKDGLRSIIKIRNYNDNLVPESTRIEQELETERRESNQKFISTMYYDYISSGKDPVELTESSINRNVIKDKLSSTKTYPRKNDPLTNRVSSYLKRDNPDKKLSQVISVEKTGLMEVNKSVRVSKNDLLSNWYFYFDVINDNGDTIQKIERVTNMDRLMELIEVPRAKPQIRGALTNIRGINYSSFMCTSSDDKNILNVDVVNGVTSFKNSTQNTNLISNIPLIGSHSTGRTFHSTNSSLGNTFSSSIVVDKRYKTLNGCVIATQRNAGIFDLLATNLHPRTISVIFYVKDLTNKSKNWTKVSGQEKVNENNQVVSAYFDGIPNHVYEFFAESYLNDGTKLDTRSDIVEAYSRPDFNLKISITNFAKSSNDITFDLSADIQDKSTDSIISLLESRGLQDYFNDKTTDQISQIKKFIGFMIYRFNISVGRREYLGVLTNGSFSDRQQSELLNVRSRDLNAEYQYEIFPTIIDPNSMYDNQVQKNYSNDLLNNWLANNSKFKQLLTKKHSTIFTTKGLKDKFSSNLLNNNVIGYCATYNVGKITGIVIENFVVKNSLTIGDEYHTTLEWRCENNSAGTAVDYFLINRCCNGRNIDNIGKISYSQKLNGVFNFIDICDIYGNITYQIIPVYNNGIVGSVSTAKIFINGS